MEHLVFSINAILPIFLVIVLGYILKKVGLMDAAFTDKLSNLVFRVGLPALVFLKAYQTDFSQILTGNMTKVVILGSASMLGSSILIYVVARLLIKDKFSVGAFAQGAFRSNYAFIGIPLMNNLFGDTGVAHLVVMLVPIMIIYNSMAVIFLTLSAGEKGKGNVGSILKKIAANPLIIGIVAGALFGILHVPLPDFTVKSLTYLSDVATPMALLSVGAFLDIKKAKQKIRLGMIATVIKLVLCPVIFTIIPYMMGIRGVELAVLYVLFAAPTAVSSFVMAKSMKNDGSLAASIVVLTTMLSSLTIFLGVYILKTIQAF